MTRGGAQETCTPSTNNTRFIVGERNFDQVFEGTLAATILTHVPQINSR
jgi:hypothetical protein